MVEWRHTDKSAPIGVFDSGVGGLTVVREIMRQIPNEKIIYFGDTARLPYGSKSRETVTRFSRQIVRFLNTFQVKTIVVACNTASAYALDELERESDIPMIGVVKPGARVASEVTRNGRIGVIATEATIGSKIYNQYITQLNKDVTIYGKACPLFVPLVEEGLWSGSTDNGYIPESACLYPDRSVPTDISWRPHPSPDPPTVPPPPEEQTAGMPFRRSSRLY